MIKILLYIYIKDKIRARNIRVALLREFAFGKIM